MAVGFRGQMHDHLGPSVRAVHLSQADRLAEQHLQRFNPEICGRNAVVNRGAMSIKGFVVSIDEKSRLDALADELW